MHSNASGLSNFQKYTSSIKRKTYMKISDFMSKNTKGIILFNKSQ